MTTPRGGRYTKEGPVKRFRTTARVLIHSHVAHRDLDGKESSAPIDLSLSVISISTEKNIKGSGKATIVLAPTQNFFQLIYPNDYINIYFARGDSQGDFKGSGYVRTFFGLVDRISESSSVSTQGVITTQFKINCTDFYKVFEKTGYEFNPNLRERNDLKDQDSAQIAPGNGLSREVTSRGIIASGTPAEILYKFIFAFLGFDSQFVVPPAYVSNRTRVERRIEQAKNFIFQDLTKELKKAFGSDILADRQAKASSAKSAKDTNPASAAATQSLSSFLKKRGIKSVDDVTQDAVTELFNDENFIERFSGDAGISVYINAQKIIKKLKADYFINLVDLEHFIERDAMDGFLSGSAAYQELESLAALLQSRSNEIVNELIFDLRPIAFAEKEGIGTYSTEADELNGNVISSNRPKGVEYVPAVVFREYPFSTISEVPVGSKKPIKMNGIFHDQPNVEGPHFVAADAISLTREAGQTTTLKRLDVVVLETKELISIDIGRSDRQHLNMFQVLSDYDIGQIKQKVFLKDSLPIVSLAHIKRHGLRKLERKSVFSKFGFSSPRGLDPDKASELEASGNRPNANNPVKNLDNALVSSLVIRWSVLLDHWNQHNLEYLDGTIVTTGAPHIRVGYRLDLRDRNLSFYVESVNHSWTYTQDMRTTIKVSRGQPNNPFPAYVLPSSNSFEVSGVNPKVQRNTGSRLEKYFSVSSPHAVSRGQFWHASSGTLITPALRGLHDDPDNRVDRELIDGTSEEKYVHAKRNKVTTAVTVDGDPSKTEQK